MNDKLKKKLQRKRWNKIKKNCALTNTLINFAKTECNLSENYRVANAKSILHINCLHCKWPIFVYVNCGKSLTHEISFGLRQICDVIDLKVLKWNETKRYIEKKKYIYQESSNDWVVFDYKLCCIPCNCLYDRIQ